MKSFDEILKKGKDNAKATLSPFRQWKKHINILMESLHRLNNLYDDNTVHHLKVEPYNCKDCNKASFVLAIKDIDNHRRVIRFHRANWKPVEKGVYYCERCKKGKKK